jgi:hypothetical protein
LYWIIDAYTSSIYYPYSRHYRAGNQWANYMRNSVKVVVDAYNGTANYYVFDTQDPIIQAYRGAFPKLFRDAQEMPAGLREHVRYPELLFRTQADVYGLYHMQNVGAFFGREDPWSVAGAGNAQPGQAMLPPGLAPRQGQGPNFASQPSTQDGPTAPIDPYFVVIPLPGEKSGEEFVQILPFTPSNRKNMIGWMAGRSDAQGRGTLLSYDFPKDKQVTGPEQFRARINQDSYLAGQITLWNQQGSNVLRGNLLVIPLGQGLLYVEPIFLQATQSGIPSCVWSCWAHRSASLRHQLPRRSDKAVERRRYNAHRHRWTRRQSNWHTTNIHIAPTGHADANRVGTPQVWERRQVRERSQVRERQPARLRNPVQQARRPTASNSLTARQMTSKPISASWRRVATARPTNVLNRCAVLVQRAKSSMILVKDATQSNLTPSTEPTSRGKQTTKTNMKLIHYIYYLMPASDI